jgi:hypothetical protein
VVLSCDVTGIISFCIHCAKKISAIDIIPEEVFDENKRKVSEMISKENNLNRLYLFIFYLIADLPHIYRMQYNV